MIDCLVRVVTSIDRLIYGRYFVRSIFFAAHNSYDESDIFDLNIYCRFGIVQYPIKTINIDKM